MSIKITKTLKLIIIGMLLGDANLQTFSYGKKARLRIVHGFNQKPYIEHKYNLLKPIIRTKLLPTVEKRDTKTYYKFYFNTVSLTKFKFYYDLFYKRGKKVLPKNIHRYLEPITLAYWYMDDGSLKWKNRSKAVRLCTDNFEKHEVLHLIDILNKKYQLDATIYKQRSRFRIYIPNKNYAFTKLIKPYVINSLLYKVPIDID